MGVSQIMGSLFWGVPRISTIRTIVYWGLYWGPLILGNYPIPQSTPGTWAFVACEIRQVSQAGVLGLYWGYVGIMEKKMETTMMGFCVYWGGDIRVILGLHWDNGKMQTITMGYIYI